MKKKVIITITVLIIFCVTLITFIYKNKDIPQSKLDVAVSTVIAKFKVNEKVEEQPKEQEDEFNIEIQLKDLDGKQTTYSFEYKGYIYTAIFKNGCWKIIDSYKIKNSNVMNAICEELIKAHPVLGKDRITYRTAGDMVYEWVQHNLAYSMLSDKSEFKASAKDVDFDPEDQGRTFMEIYEDRTGKKFNINDIISSN